jgi:hypothetical protein
MTDIYTVTQLEQSWDNYKMWVVTGDGLRVYMKKSEGESVPKHVDAEMFVYSKTQLVDKLRKYIRNKKYTVHV